MDERLSDLVAELRERFTADTRVDEVEAFLSSEGFDRGQIGEIVALFFADRDGAPSGVRPLIHTQMTFRVMGPHERGRFAPEAWGHLLSLNGAGILNAAELEHVIERAMQHIDGRIALDDLRAMLEGAGYDEAGGGPGDNVTVH
jgi:Smg protein